MSSYTWFDILLLAVAAIATILGLLKGLARELIGVAAALAGLILAANYYPNLSHILRDLITPRQARDFISFGIIFVVLLLLGFMVGRMISGRMSGAFKFLDRLLGAVFGFLKGAFFCGVIVLALTVFPSDKDVIVRSRLAPAALRITQAVIRVVPKELKDRFVESYNRVVRIRKGGADGKKNR
jgi:membrane protein required for colicin V production